MFSLCIITYLNGVKRDVVHVVDHAQQTVRESNKGSTQQEDEVMLIQTHLSRTITAENKQSHQTLVEAQKAFFFFFCGSCLPITQWAWVAECLVSVAYGDGTTPSHYQSHDTMNQGVEKLTWVEQVTQQGNFGAWNRRDN